MDHRDGRLADAAVAAAEAGGAVVRDLFGRPVSSWEKSRADYTSEADVESERAVESVLARATPGIAFVGEESGGGLTDLCWVVDPLDGTTNFLRGYPSVAVSVALVEEGEPVVGAVHAPFLGETFWAAAGQGAWGKRGRLSVRHRPLGEAVCATGFPYRRPDRLPEYLDVLHRVLLATADVRRVSPVSLDLALVASGVFDGVFEIDLKPCDVAAGALLVVEAGGVVTDWHGGADWLRSGEIVAGAPAVHDALVQATTEVAAAYPAAEDAAALPER